MDESMATEKATMGVFGSLWKKVLGRVRENPPLFALLGGMSFVRDKSV